MRVTIEHREESAGLTGGTKHHYVDCTVEFSEEEKAIIKARDLYNHNFTVGPAIPISSGPAYAGVVGLNLLGRLMVIGGIGLFVISPAIGEIPYGPLGFFGAIAGGGVWAYAAFAARRQDKRVDEPVQVIKLGKLLSAGRFTVYASSPAQAQGVEEDIRNELSRAKQFLVSSADLKPKQTFEL